MIFRKKLFMSFFFTVTCLYFSVGQQADISSCVSDLYSYNTFGYRGRLYNQLHLQGSLVLTGYKTDFSILGYGFFKLIDEKTQTAFFSRFGKFFKKDNIFYDSRGYRVAVKTDNSFELYVPQETATVFTSDGIYFTFSGANITAEGSVVNNCLEQSNVSQEKMLDELLVMLSSHVSGNTAEDYGFFFEYAAEQIRLLKSIYATYNATQNAAVLFFEYIPLLEANKPCFLQIAEKKGNVILPVR